jgi:hypothetical protein
VCGGRRASADASGLDGHADIKTTMVYRHYAPGANEAELVEGVFDATNAPKRSASSDESSRAAGSDDRGQPPEPRRRGRRGPRSCRAVILTGVRHGGGDITLALDKAESLRIVEGIKLSTSARSAE